MIGKKAALILVLSAVLLSACAGPEDILSANVPEQNEGALQTAAAGADRLEAMYSSYEAALSIFYYEKVLPDGTYLDSEDYGMDGNAFAVFDIDGDGMDELIIEYSSTSIANMIELIYGYDAETGELYEEFMRFPNLFYYDNGIIKAFFSRNQGLAGRFWPYYLYEYDPAQDRYECVAMVDAWDGSIYGVDYSGKPFPGEIDVSGEGIVYYLSGADEKTLNEPVDRNEYERWLDGYVGDAKELTVPMVPLTPENIAEGARGTSGLRLKSDGSAERNFYSAATSLSKAEVERMALEVRGSILARDWETLAQYVDFPVMVNGEECPNSAALEDLAAGLMEGDTFAGALISETCEEMPVSRTGIIMAGGCIHLSETEAGELRVTAINMPA